MGRKNSPSANKELNELIAQYETAKAENRQLYLDGDQLADIALYAAGGMITSDGKGMKELSIVINKVIVQ